MFNFERLIKKYSKFPVTFKKHGQGYYDYKNGGVWVKGPEEIIEIEGAIVPLSNAELNYDGGGSYSSEDRKLYTYTNISLNTKVTHKEREYTVNESKDYTDFDDGLNVYFMKRVIK